MTAAASAEAGLQVPLPTRRATVRLARAVARALGAGDLVVLSGTLGAGKTFLVRALCRALGLRGQERVTSPTFALVHEYRTVPKVVHADLYRLSSAAEVSALGLVEQRDAGAALVVEWGSPFVDLLGGDALEIDLRVEPRVAGLRASGPRAREILASLCAALSPPPSTA